MLSSPDGRPELPADAQMLRYVSGRLVQGDVVDGAAFKLVDGDAFKPAVKDAGELSVNQLGVCSADPAEDIAEIRRVKQQWLELRKSGRFAEIKVGCIEECAVSGAKSFGYWASPVLAAEYGKEGVDDDHSHAVIVGLPETDEDSAIALRDMIAMKVSKLHPGKI